MNELFVTYKGWKVPAIPDICTRLEHFETDFTSRKDDIWICAYPKSGTHWLNEIVRMLRDDSLGKGPPKEKFFVEMTSHEDWETIQSPRVLNTHLAPSLLPEGVFKNKILFIVRNLKDVFVSHYHHYLAIHGQHNPIDWNEFFEMMLVKMDTFQYHHEWMKVANDNPETILVLNYEIIKESPTNNIAKIAQFLGMEKREDFYESVAKATGIEAMKANYKDDIVQLPNSEATWSIGKLYRKGVIGDWKNLFTKDQCQRFNQVYQKEFEGLSLGNEKYMDL